MTSRTKNFLEIIKYTIPFILILASSIFIDVLNIIDYVMIKQIYILPLLIWLFVFFITIPEPTK